MSGQLKFTNRIIRDLEPRKRAYRISDSGTRRLGIMVYPTGQKSFVFDYRSGPNGAKGRSRRIVIGGFPDITVDQARRAAEAHNGTLASGGDPRAKATFQNQMPTLAELSNMYWQHVQGLKKKTTLTTDRGRIDRHILPLLGHLKVNDITRLVVERFMQDIALGRTAVDEKTGKHGRARVTGGKGTATRTVGLLGGMLSYAIELGFIDNNPVSGVKRFPDRVSDDYLREPEMRRLDQAILEARASHSLNPVGLDIIQILRLTGARKSEIEGLTWSMVDMEALELRLPDSKTGQKKILLLPSAAAILERQPKTLSSYVFPAHRGGGHTQVTRRVWDKLRVRAQLPTARLHDLRHAFASALINRGVDLPQVGGLLGHRDPKTTKRYAHLRDESLRAALHQLDH